MYRHNLRAQEYCFLASHKPHASIQHTESATFVLEPDANSG